MKPARHLTVRSLALATVILLSGVLAASARAGEYGGLGGLAVFKAGRNGGHLEVNPRSHRAFGVAPDGSSYIAEETQTGEEHYVRIEKLSSTGEYLAEGKLKLGGSAHQLDGVAIDAEKQRLYVLAADERNSEVEVPVFDPEAPVATELYAWSTTVKEGKLEPAAGTSAGLLSSKKNLNPLSEEAGVPLLHPHGIAVDPTTHDVMILGQQDVSTKKGAGEESLRAAVQRVHTEGADAGRLGPRYVDDENCLDEGAAIVAEPACTEGFGQPSSPFVSPGGRVYGERLGELWEVPATQGVSESFAPGARPTTYEVEPKRLFTIGRGQGIEGQESIVEPVSEEEGEGGALAFVSTGPGEGKVYLDAEITAEEGEGRRSQNRGAVVLDYSEGGGTPVATERGWTAGQNGTGENEKCILPLGSAPILVGADSSGRMLLLDVTTAIISSGTPATVNVLQFGSGGEECGHAQATPPSATIAGEAITKARLGEKATLSLNVFDADTEHVEWRFQNGGKEEADEPPTQESYPFPTQTPALEHEFKHAGNYEIVAIVEPDDFGTKLEEHSTITVEGATVGAEFSYTSSATTGQPAKFTAKVTDPYKISPHVQYKYVWAFGDGAKAEGSGTREFRAEHAYASTGLYEVKLTVTDEGGRTAEATHTLRVSAPRAVAAISAPAPGAGPGVGGGPGGGGSASASGAPSPTGAHVPAATLAGARLLTVSALGGLKLKLACPVQEKTCSGTATLRTLTALSTRVKARAKRSVLTLATGPFTITGGHVQAITLHLSAKARELLLHMHVLRARVTLLTRDRSGAAHTTQAIVTLRLATPSHRRRR